MSRSILDNDELSILKHLLRAEQMQGLPPARIMQCKGRSRLQRLLYIESFQLPRDYPAKGGRFRWRLTDIGRQEIIMRMLDQ